MKFLSMILGIITVFSGCEKEGVIDKSSLIGTWELRQQQAGMIPTADYPSGNGALLTFTETEYRHYKNGSLLKSGTYELVKDTTVSESVGLVIPPGQYTTRIIYDNNTAAPKTFIDLREGKLYLVSGFFPLDSGVSQVYEKTSHGQQ